MLPMEKLMSDRLNGLKSQVQVPPLSLSRVSTPLGPEADLGGEEEPEPLPHAAASTAATAQAARIASRLMITFLRYSDAETGQGPSLMAARSAAASTASAIAPMRGASAGKRAATSSGG